MAEALLNLMEDHDKKYKLVKRGTENARRFHADKWIKAHEEMYSELLNRQNQPA